jgi:prepilin-type N-terminal cleavage/methylation domain-containing protein
MIRRDEGMTMIELVVAVLIMAIIIGPLSASVLVGLASVQQSEQRTTNTADQQVFASFFVHDVQSADDVSATSATCGGAGSVLELHWVDPGTAVDTRVAYVKTGAVLTRKACAATTAPDGTVSVANRDVIVANALTAAPAPRLLKDDGTVLCDAAVGVCPDGARPRSVVLPVSIKGASDGHSYETYTFNLQATRRVTS